VTTTDVVKSVPDDGTGVALSHRFDVTVGSSGAPLDLGRWTKVEGLEVAFDLADSRAGDDWNRRLIALGVPRYTNIKLTRVATRPGAAAVKDWLEQVAGRKEKSSVGSMTINVYDNQNRQAVGWILRDPVPLKWKISGSMDASKSGVLMEELEVAYDGFLADDAQAPGNYGFKPDNVGMSMRFIVDIQGVDLGGWSKCTGLGIDFKPFKREEGGINTSVYWLGDRVEYDSVTLTRPMNAVDSPKVYGWLQSRLAAYRGNIAADMFPSMVPGTTGTITLLNAQGGGVMSWSLMNVTPKKWTGPEMAADGKGVAMETLILNHEGFL
jgi:phage tail-like protein